MLSTVLSSEVFIVLLLTAINYTYSEENHTDIKIELVKQPMKNRNFTFSVIFPCCNTEAYLEKCISSVTLSTEFQDRIQIIIVNLASTDNTEELALGFVNRFPNNIVYIRTSAAEMQMGEKIALNYVRGLYVSVMECEMTWDPQCFHNLLAFIRKYNHVECMACRPFSFKEKPARLDYIYKRTRVIDIVKEPQCFVVSMTGVFIKTSVIALTSFCSDIKEQSSVPIVETVLRTRRFGVIREATFRVKDTSRSDILPPILSARYDLLYESIVNLSLSRYHRVLEYCQYLLMHDIANRIISTDNSGVVEMTRESLRSIVRTLRLIDDRVIFNQRYCSFRLRVFLLRLKYGDEFDRNLFSDNYSVFFHNSLVQNIAASVGLIEWYNIELLGNSIRMEGRDNCWLQDSDYSFFVIANETRYKPEVRPMPYFDVNSAFGIAYRGKRLIVTIPLRKGKTELKTYLAYRGQTVQIMPSYGAFSHITTLPHGFYSNSNYIITKSERSLIVEETFSMKTAWQELLYEFELLRRLKFSLVGYRILYYLFKRRDKEIWLFMDRSDFGSDNAEHLFNYIRRINPHELLPYFILSASSRDYSRIARYGAIIPFESPVRKLYTLLADKLITSHADQFIMNPFDDDKQYMRDLFQYDYIFLQHGVTQNLVFKALNEYVLNPKVFIAATRDEYKSFQKDAFGFQNSVKLTGFPRFDNLRSLAQKTPKERIVLVLPTWRRLLDNQQPGSHKGLESPDFTNSDYFKFYNSLINHKRLLSYMKQHHFKGLLGLHPNHAHQWKKFTSNHIFSVNHGFLDYHHIFIEASLLVTDYSSVAFDFAYLEKPVVYSQFDSDSFYRHQKYTKGYYNYSSMGFGPVCQTVDATVDAIIQIITSDCLISPEYRERIRETFVHLDENNCFRVFDEIRTTCPFVPNRLGFPLVYKLIAVIAAFTTHRLLHLYRSMRGTHIKRA